MPRLTVQFPEKTDEMLAELANKNEVSKTEVLRRALSLYRYLDREAREKGNKVTIADKEDKILKEIVFTE